VGSTLALTNINITGDLTDAYAYDSFGVLLTHQGQNQQPFTFVVAWGVCQEGSGGDLYQMRARYYDAGLGRFLSREAIWPVPERPQELNPYQYALSNPLAYIDPVGTEAKYILGKIGLHAVAPDMEDVMKSPLTGPLDFAGKFLYMAANPYQTGAFIVREAFRESDKEIAAMWAKQNREWQRQ